MAINPNETIHEIRQLVAVISQSPVAKDPNVDHGIALWTALDSHLSNGGDLPDDWQR